MFDSKIIVFDVLASGKCMIHYDLTVNGDLLWTLFKRGDVSSNWNLSFSSATKYYIILSRDLFLP